MNNNKITKATLLVSGLSTLGIVGGIVFAVKRQSGFWGGLGWAIVGSMAGGGIGYVLSSFMNYENNDDSNALPSDDDYRKLVSILKINDGFGQDKFKNLDLSSAKLKFGNVSKSDLKRFVLLSNIPSEQFTEENQNEWLYLMDKF